MNHIQPKPLAVVAASILALILVGCGKTVPEGFTSADFQAPPRDVIKVESHNDTFIVYLDQRTGALSAPERDRLDAFVGQFGGDRPESIHAEIHGPVASNRLTTVADAMVSHGVERAKLKLFPGERATAGGRPGAQTITIAATRAVAVAPSCPGFVDHPSAPGDNRVAPDLGCSDVSNLASMVADPADLLKGRGTPYSDGAVAAGAVELYRQDKVKTLPTTTTSTVLSSGTSASSSGGSASGGTGQ
ncbi:MAG TPA: CpaD family pilus assembly lipoprotein [Stellaceae bacterium]|nr:CpaD family pilus assembly lipoprotein [Stellaceae bacterium]